MNALLQVLAGLCLLRGAAEMILPEGDARGYCDFALGLLESLCILRALMGVLEGVF